MTSRQPDEVTVADIAATADMTSAAIYYHFSSKDEIFREGMDLFVTALIDQVTIALNQSRSSGEPVGEVMSGLVSWMDNRRHLATVYFATSSAQYSAVEVMRRRARATLTSSFQAYLCDVHPHVTHADAAVMAVGLLSLLETASTSWLRQDPDWMNLGSRRFLGVVAEVTQSLVQTSPRRRPPVPMV